jgi:hypothetical protein
MHPLKVAVLFFALPAFSFGQTPVPPVSGSSAARLPVTRVILYKNGVGYFEHSGHVRGSQDVNVDFTALRKEITEVQQKRDAAQSALTTMIENLQMEATL